MRSIVINPDICNGRPVIERTRITAGGKTRYSASCLRLRAACRHRQDLEYKSWHPATPVASGAAAINGGTSKQFALALTVQLDIAETVFGFGSSFTLTVTLPPVGKTIDANTGTKIIDNVR